MTKPLDPELKAIRALNRAMKSCPPEAQERVFRWFGAYWADYFARKMFGRTA